MLDILKFILKLILIGLIPALLLFVSKSDYVLDYLINKDFLITIENKEVVKFWLFLLGTFTAALIVPVKLFITEKKLKKQTNLLKNQVNVILEQICRDLDVRTDSISLRVFKVTKPFFSKTVKLNSYYIDNITTIINGKKDLVFEVNNDEVQGVVGRTYVEKSFFVDYNITNDDNSYQLTSELKNRIGDVQFCCAAPIVFDKEKIKYIISLDSNELIHKSAPKTALLKRNLVYLSQLFDEFIL